MKKMLSILLAMLICLTSTSISYATLYETEPNNTFETADSFPLGETINASGEYGGYDYFVFNAEKTGKVDFIFESIYAYHTVTFNYYWDFMVMTLQDGEYVKILDTRISNISEDHSGTFTKSLSGIGVEEGKTYYVVIRCVNDELDYSITSSFTASSVLNNDSSNNTYDNDSSDGNFFTAFIQFIMSLINSIVALFNSLL